MKNRIMDKLRSRTGASITFALLLFIVCAVLCSVILTAATASSGRMSQIPETDQRYYAVTSAAELLQELIDGKTVSYMERKITFDTTTYTEGTVTGTDQRIGDHVAYIVPDTAAEDIGETYDVPQNRIYFVGVIPNLDENYKNNSILKDAALKIVFETPEDGYLLADRGLALTSGTYDRLAVTISESLDENGVLKLTLYNTKNAKGEDSKAGERYTVVMSFGVNQTETSDTKSEFDSMEQTVDPEHPEKECYSETIKTTVITTKTMTWELTGISTFG